MLRQLFSYLQKNKGVPLKKILSYVLLLAINSQVFGQEETHESVVIKIQDGVCHDWVSPDGGVYFGTYRYLEVIDASSERLSFRGDRLDNGYICLPLDFRDLTKYFQKKITVEMKIKSKHFPSRRVCEHNPGQRGQCDTIPAYTITTYIFQLEGISWEYRQEN